MADDDDAKRGNTQMVTVRLPLDEYEVLRDCSFYTGRSMNELVKLALRTFLSEYAREQNLVAEVDKATKKTKRGIKRLDDT